MKFKRYKQFWLLIIKLSIIFGAGFFIYTRLFENNKLQINELVHQVKIVFSKDWWLFYFLISLTLLNWLFEILKWQILVKSIRPLAFVFALSQSLSSHTLSIITPFKAGEYVGKTLYYSKLLQKKILLLNLVGNTAQLFVTVFVGTIGIVYFFYQFEVPINPHKIKRIAYVIALLVLGLFFGRNHIFNKKEGYYRRALQFFKGLSSEIKAKTIIYSFIRYLFFSHQFYFLLWVFGVEITYLDAMMLIYSMYFIATLLPVISLFDFVIKGSIAIYLFSFLQVDELTILIISTLMWIVNFALPAIIGSYFVLRFTPK